MSNDYYMDERVAADYDAANGAEREITRDDIPFYTGLAREAALAGARVLELGCGTGRVTLAMAETGAAITGLDNAPQMLDVARRKATDGGLSGIVWVEGDMARFRFRERFGLIVIPYRSFQLLPTVEAQRACLACIREHLTPDGRLAFNVFNPAILAPATATTPTAAARAGLGRKRAGDDAQFTVAERNLRMRWVFRDEMERLLREGGFAVEALDGWFDGRPFDEESSEMVWQVRPA